MKALKIVGGSLLACCVPAAATAQAPIAAVQVIHNGNRTDFSGSVIHICRTDTNTIITRITHARMTMVGITGNGDVCQPDESPDLVLNAVDCTIVQGDFKGHLDQGCEAF